MVIDNHGTDIAVGMVIDNAVKNLLGMILGIHEQDSQRILQGFIILRILARQRNGKHRHHLLGQRLIHLPVQGLVFASLHKNLSPVEFLPLIFQLDVLILHLNRIFLQQDILFGFPDFQHQGLYLRQLVFHHKTSVGNQCRIDRRFLVFAQIGILSVHAFHRTFDAIVLCTSRELHGQQT